MKKRKSFQTQIYIKVVSFGLSIFFGFFETMAFSVSFSKMRWRC